jgi:hypothetical protein
MNTIIIKHDDRGGFKAIGTDGEPVRIILLEDDHIDEANIKVAGDSYIGYEMTVKSEPELVSLALASNKDKLDWE